MNPQQPRQMIAESDRVSLANIFREIIDQLSAYDISRMQLACWDHPEEIRKLSKMNRYTYLSIPSDFPDFNPDFPDSILIKNYSDFLVIKIKSTELIAWLDKHGL